MVDQISRGVPDRLVTSAKSWLSNPHIDPKRPILPWQSDTTEEKPPFECSRRYPAASQRRKVSSFNQRLRELGWVDGSTVSIVYRWAEGKLDRFSDFAAEFHPT